MSIHKLKTNLDEIGDIVEADQDDLDFLKNFLNNPAFKSILQVRIHVLTLNRTISQFSYIFWTNVLARVLLIHFVY